jgi:anhydro-N-acetylmuramic acid kinase
LTIPKSFSKKIKKSAIGLMSGTSVDGIDAALVDITGSGNATKYRLRAFITHPYPRGFKEFLLKISEVSTARVDDIARADMLVAEFFADAARRVATAAGRSLQHVDFIGSHGQTIHHLPRLKSLYGKSVRSTFQIGNPSAIAKFTGVLTVGDFRVGDIAAGGSGAPLVPLFDYLTLRSRTIHRGVLNLGGIANLTVLPRNCTPGNIIAFDTGPGNMLIDGLANEYFHIPCDRGGEIASAGILQPKLLRWLVSHPYLKLRPPKSTGRETFGKDLHNEILRRSVRFSHTDVLTTVTEFTAISIFQGYREYVRPSCRLSEIVVSGGGIHNLYLMESLKRYFEGITLLPSDHMNISSDAKEAICFALLANETLAGHPGNIPRATGANRETILGVIALP